MQTVQLSLGFGKMEVLSNGMVSEIIKYKLIKNIDSILNYNEIEYSII
jgi:hypothetical protein